MRDVGEGSLRWWLGSAWGARGRRIMLLGEEGDLGDERIIKEER